MKKIVVLLVFIPFLCSAQLRTASNIMVSMHSLIDEPVYNFQLYETCNSNGEAKSYTIKLGYPFDSITTLYPSMYANEIAFLHMVIMRCLYDNEINLEVQNSDNKSISVFGSGKNLNLIVEIGETEELEYKLIYFYSAQTIIIALSSADLAALDAELLYYM